MNIAELAVNGDNGRSLGKAVTHVELKAEISKSVNILLVDARASDDDHAEIAAELV